MKYVHTFWIDEGKDPLDASFGWCSARYHLMSWALSCLQLHRFYDNVELITDRKGKELLIDQMKLPYKKVRIELDDLDLVEIPGLWVMKKIYSYTLHKEPFLNVDGDVFIFEPFPDNLLSGQLIAQNIEQEFDYYKELVSLVGNTFPFVPKPIKKQISEGLEIQASNAGILGGNDSGFFKDYYQVVEKFISENYEQISGLSPSQMVNFNAVVEQYIFHCLSNDKGIEVNYLMDIVYDPSFFESFANFHHLPNKIPFMHALGDYKKNGWVCDQLANRLRLDYPEYYYRIISFFEPQTQYFKGYISSAETKVSPDIGSGFSNIYSKKSEEENFCRTRQMISSICHKEQIPLDMKITILKANDYLEKELTNTSWGAHLRDVFEFEKEKMRLIQSLPSDNHIWENEVIAIDNANQVFADNNWQSKLELRLLPHTMTLESEWDWAHNPLSFTRVKVNNVEKNLHLASYYYQTLLLIDKHHMEVIEYSLDPIEIYLLSMLSIEGFISFAEVMEKMNLFFEHIENKKMLNYVEEAIRFLSYSGVVFLKLKV